MDDRQIDTCAALVWSPLRRASTVAITFDWAETPVVYHFPDPFNAVAIAVEALALFLAFPTKRGAALSEVMEQAGQSPYSCPREVIASLARLITFGALVPDCPEGGVYTGPPPSVYRSSRKVPTRIAQAVAETCGITGSTTVLDLCAGVGDLAIELAGLARTVTAVEISQACVAEAVRRAKENGAEIEFVLGCAHKTAYTRKKFDVVVASQAMYWLDTAFMVAAIGRALHEQGRFCAIETKMRLAPAHPLHRLCGLGQKSEAQVLDRCEDHVQHYSGAFQRTWGRRFGMETVRVYRERRMLDLSFAKAYCLGHRLALRWPNEADPWAPLEAAFAEASTRDLFGEVYWLIVVLADGIGAGESGETAPNQWRPTVEEA